MHAGRNHNYDDNKIVLLSKHGHCWLLLGENYHICTNSTPTEDYTSDNFNLYCITAYSHTHTHTHKLDSPRQLQLQTDPQEAPPSHSVDHTCMHNG